MDSNMKQNRTLMQLVNSKEWMDYFHTLSHSSGFEFHVYNGEFKPIFITNENPLCEYIKSASQDDLKCRESCNIAENVSGNAEGPVIHKCGANVFSFALPLGASDDEGMLVGRGGFASYDALMEFFRIVKESALPEIPFTMPFNFPGEDYVKAVSMHVALAVNFMKGSFGEKHKLEEKLLRMTSLFDRKTFSTLSRNPELMYRYILDTIGFVFGRTSSVFLAADKKNSVYRAVYATGTHKNAVIDLRIDEDNTVIKQMLDTGRPVYYEKAAEFGAAGPLEKRRHYYFYPIFIGGALEGVIGIFDREFFREDLKIMNSFNDYIQLNLENHALRIVAERSRGADEKLSVLMDFSNSASSILDMEGLSSSLLDKSMRLIDAEQGSLMFLDDEGREFVVEAKKSIDGFVKEKMRIKKEGCISGMVLESGESLLVEDIESDPRIKKQNRPRYRTKSFVSVPIIVEDEVSGVLNLSDKLKKETFSQDDLKLIQSFINNISLVIERNLLQKKAEELQKLSITDPLTGIYNRRYLNKRLSEEITRYNRYKHPFSFMLLDLDKFKQYNDTYGHISGDNLIKELAKLVEESLRTVDIAARFGGDEFVAIFPQTPKEDAIQITNRIKERIDIALGRGHGEIPLSVSMGLATYPDDASSIMELIEKTDQALYLAKKGGGNRVVYL
jgi:diguanylate cyclase (GGDEF)-like protein